MKERYEHYFWFYLKICADPEGLGTEKQLRDRIRLTDHLMHELYGMLTIMADFAEMTESQAIYEKERVLKTFSPARLFGAYIGEDGEVYSLRREETCRN